MVRKVGARTGTGASARKLRVLVAGGAGFLGSHLCERILFEGYGVMCMDNPPGDSSERGVF